MKNLFLTTLMALTVGLTLVTPPVQADIGDHVQNAGESFEKDAEKFGTAIKSISGELNSQIGSGAVRVVTGPSGQAVMLVGDVTLAAATAVARAYDNTQGALKCLAKDPLNPFKDSGCVVQFAGQTLILAVTTLGDGSQTLIVGAADALSEAFGGFKSVLQSMARHTGGTSNPVGTFFVLAYHLTKGGEAVVHFALVDVAARSISILAEEGTTLVSAPISALYNIVTLKWKRAGVKLINIPVKLVNSLVNIPVRIIFGKKKKDTVLRTLSPLGRWVNKRLHLDNDKVNALADAP
ncbi:MAG: hypothetical protein V4736_15950 [Bdellovibrionota bacterium]